MLKSTFLILFFAVSSLGQSSEPKELWYFQESSVASALAVQQSEAIVNQAVAAGYTGIVLRDAAIDALQSPQSNYLQELVQYAQSKGLKVMPLGASYGHSARAQPVTAALLQVDLAGTKLQSTAPIHLVRGPGMPLKIYDPKNPSHFYAEGTDFMVSPDAGISVPAGSSLKPGETVAMDCYAAKPVYADAAAGLTDPSALQGMRATVEAIGHKFPNAAGYMFGYDDLGNAANKLLASHFGQVYNLFKTVDPTKRIYVWSDAFDPFKNAGAWSDLPADVIVVNTDLANLTGSANWFSGRNPQQQVAHAQVIAGYFDSGDGASAAALVLDQVQGVPGITGLMYKTLNNDYSELASFADAARAGWAAYSASIENAQNDSTNVSSHRTTVTTGAQSQDAGANIAVRFSPGTNDVNSRVYNMNNLGWVYSNSTNWAVFNAYPAPERPAGVSPPVTYTVIGPTVGAPSVDAPYGTVSGVSWTGGTTNGAGSGQRIVAHVSGTGNGFRITIPLGSHAAAKRVVFVGGAWQSDTTLSVSYSDGSASPTVRQDIVARYNTYSEAYYSIDAQAATDNANLILDWIGLGSFAGNLTTNWIGARFVAVAPIPPADPNLSWYTPHAGPPIEVPPGTPGTNIVPLALGANLQAAVNAASPGDVITLPDNYLWQGNLLLPAKPVVLDATGHPKNVTIKAASWSVPAGQRAIPSDFKVTIETLNSGACIVNDASNPNLAARKANNYRFEGIKCQMTGDLSGPGLVYYGIFIAPEGNNLQGDSNYVPDGIELAHMWVHGGDNTANKQHGILIDGSNVRIADSIVDNIAYRDGVEAGGITYLSGVGPYTIVNNYIEAAGENFLASGVPTTHPWAKPHDIVLRQNYSQKRLSWFVPGGPVQKNSFEFKAGQNILEEGNLTEFGWSNGQVATAYMFTPRTGGIAYWTGISNVVVQNNTIRNYPRMSIIGLYDDLGINFLPEQLQFVHDITYQNNRALNISSKRWAWGCVNCEINAMGYEIVTLPDHLTLKNNTTSFLEGATGNIDMHTGIYKNQSWVTDTDIENNILGAWMAGDGAGSTSALVAGPLAKFTNNSMQYLYANQYSGYQGPFPQMGNVWSTYLNLANVGGNTFGTAPQAGIGANDAQLDTLETLARYGNRVYPDFTVAFASPAIQNDLGAGAPLSLTINQTAINGFSGTVTYSAYNVPAGVSAVFNPPTVTGTGTTKLTLTASGSPVLGFSPVSVMGFSGPYVYHQDAITLNVVSSSSSVNGVVTDSSNHPLPGVTIDGGSLGTTVSASDGSYSFPAVVWGPATLTPSLANYVFTPPSASVGVTGGNQVANFVGTPASPVTVSTTSLPGGTVGALYSATLAGAGGTAPLKNWTVASGSLPQGLTLNSATGTISGTPATATGSPFAFNVTVSDSAGSVSAPRSLSIAIAGATPPMVTIESPAAGATVAGTITISGWAIDNAVAIGTAISTVQVKVDGAVVGNATYGGSRPDVCSAYPGRPGCPNVGYSFALNTASLTGGAHTVTVTATDSDTSPDSSSVSVAITVAAAPAVQIESPVSGSTVSGMINVSGWALDNASYAGTAIASVQVKVDGSTVANATYGSSRPDVCATYPGRPGCPNVGFSYQLNSAWLAPGTHTITVVATDSDGTPDAGSSTVTVTIPALPYVYIDSPVAGSTLSGIATISGWALDNLWAVGTGISGVQIKVDGAVVGNATYGTSRPDVCNFFRGRVGCPNVGFTYALNTATLSAGNHVITVSATDSDSVADVGSATVNVTVAAGPPTLFIDSPTPGMAISGPVTLTGWALDLTAISSVQVKLDGAVLGNATYGISRPDACAAYPGRPGCPNVGFSYFIDTTRLFPGTHTLTVTAIDTDSTPDSTSVSVTITVPTLPYVYIDAPIGGSTVSGTVNISGWAIDSLWAVGTAISTVQVKVDGAFAGNANYGTSRTDVCNFFAGRPGCPNVGFNYQLNTASLAAGPHTITVTATDSDFAADMGSASVTVIK